MPLEKLDKCSRDLLAYLKSNEDLSSATLADAFNQHYKAEITDAFETLIFLESQGLVHLKKTEEDVVIMVQLTHLGKMYEQNLAEDDHQRRKKLWSDRIWNIATLILSAIISAIISFLMGGKT